MLITLEYRAERNMEESLIETTNNQEIKRSKLIINTPLVQTYEYVFPNSTFVMLRIACINDYPFASSVAFLYGSAIHIEEIIDWNTWIQFIAIRKRLNEIKIAEVINNEIFHKFDAVKCIYKGKIYGIYSNQITTSLAAFVAQTKPDSKKKQRIVNQYKAIMNDLQEHQIGIGMHFQTESLRVNIHEKVSKPSIRVDHSFVVRSLGLLTAQYHFGESYNSYEKDIRLMQDILEEIFTDHENKTFESPNTSPEILTKLEDVINYTSLLADLATLPFTEVLKSNKHTKVLHQPSFLKHLYKHFMIQANLKSAAQLVAYQKQLLIESVKISPQKIKELDKCLLLHTHIKNQQQKFQATSKTYAESLRKLYYNPLQLPPNQKVNSFVTTSEIEKKLKSITPISKFSQCQYHFLKAKQSWLNLNFYRALAHLQKAKTFTKSPKLLSTIYLQMGRLWSHLCDNTNAQKYYLSALKLRQQSQGRESIQLLSILQNLIILHSRMFHNQKVIDLQNRCDSIKKRYGNGYIRILPHLAHSISTQSLFGNITNALQSSTKASKLISKEDIIKMQIERIPSLAKVWQIAKPFFEKGQKDERKNLEENESLFEIGQLNQLYCMLKLLCFVQGQYILTYYEQQRVLQALMQAESNNQRMYYRFVFLLSYYYEKRSNIKEALKYATIMFNATVFPLTIINSFRKRTLQLAKKANDLVCIREIYSDIDWLSNQGMMEELYNSAIFFQKEGSHLLCIKSCNKYMQQIKQYSYSDSNKRSKTIDRSQALMLIMINQQISLHLFSEAWANIKQLKERKKGDKKELNELAVYFCFEAFRDNQHSYCLQAFSELIVMQELHKMDDKQRKEVFLAVIGALLKSNKQITQHQQVLMSLYEGINFTCTETGFTVLVRKIEDISKRKLSWTTLYNKLIQIKESSTGLDKCCEYPLTFELEQLCCRLFQIDQAKKYNLKFVQRINEMSDTQLRQLQDFILDLICKIANTKGKASPSILFLHVLLYQTTTIIRNIQSKVLLLLWISTWPQEVQNVWNNQLQGSKKDRELYLDQLLNQLIEKDRSKSRFQALWWFDGKYKDLLKLLSCYKSISQSDCPKQSDILDFKILFGCYFSLQTDESVFCKGIADKLLSYSDEQFL